ncbi:MAG TPA: outer membrane beta-barrel protein [Sphingobium sp.]
MTQHKMYGSKSRKTLRLSCATLAFLCSMSATAAWSQESLLIEPSLPPDFDRGRNISVTQRERPDYDPIGIRAGSFNVFPQLSASLGYSDNIYYSTKNTAKDGFIQLSPSVLVNSDWSRHSLRLRAGSQIQRYFSETRRNQTPWDFAALGTLEMGESLRLTPEVQIEKDFETPFSGETTADNAVLSSYVRKYAGLRGEYSGGQTKLSLAVNNTNFQFDDIVRQSGAVFDQGNRDRNIFRVSGQAQYAFTPSVAAYAQLGYAHTVYDEDLQLGVPNRDSDGYTATAGFNFDLSGLLRGTIGLGYSRRNFRADLFRDIDGFSAEGKLEYFPSDLTTITLAARRVIEDSNLGSTSGFFDNRASLRVDHELRRNVIVNLLGEVARQDYVDSAAAVDVYRISGGGVLMSSNWLSFNLNVAYTGRNSNNPLVGQDFNEFRGQIGIVLKR